MQSRKTQRRDKQLEAQMLVMEKSLAAHVQDCSLNAIAMRQELSMMNAKFDTYHAQNRVVNQEQVELLQILVTSKRVAVWTGKAVKVLVGLLASAATALGLYSFFRAH